MNFQRVVFKSQNQLYLLYIREEWVFNRKFIQRFCSIFQSFEQDEDDQYGQSYDDRNYSKEFNFGGYDNDGDGSGNILNEQKPRIILMGLRRYAFLFLQITII